jgi:Ca2+-binding EF-hand superfamily protein
MLLLAPRVVSAEELDAARRAFQALDLDGDGLISRGELGLHLMRTPELEVDEDHTGAVLDLADVRNVGVIDLAAFLVALLAIREPDLDPERVAQQTFNALGAEANHGTISLQQVAQVINTPVLRSLEIAARIHYMTLLQALPPVRSVPLEEFIYLYQQHVARGTPFAPEDPEDDDADDLDDGFPLHNVLSETLSTLASFAAGPFDACMLCKNVGRRRHGSNSMKHDFLQSS